MSIQTVAIGTRERKRPPIQNAPVVELLLGENGDLPTAVASITIPPGGGMPEHDHGGSLTVITPISGSARLIDAAAGDQVIELEPGTVATIPVGHRVAVENPGEEDARLIATFTPPDFVLQLRSWPNET